MHSGANHHRFVLHIRVRLHSIKKNTKIHFTMDITMEVNYQEIRAVRFFRNSSKVTLSIVMIAILLWCVSFAFAIVLCERTLAVFCFNQQNSVRVSIR